MAFLLMMLYLWVLPTGHTIALRNLAFFSLIILTLWSAWRHKLRLRLPLAWPWMAYALVALFSLSYAIDPAFSFGEIKKEVGYGVLALMLGATWVRNVRSLESLLAVIIIGDIFLVGAALSKAIIFDPFWHHPLSEAKTLLYTGPGSFLYNGVGDFSTYLVTVLPLITAYTFSTIPSQRVRRNALLLLLALNVLALFLTGNRMGFIVLIAETVFALGFLAATYQKSVSRQSIIRATVALLAASGLVALFLYIYAPPHDPRHEIWAVAVADIQEKPLTGAGFGRCVLPLRNPDFFRETQSNFEHAHNMVLNKGIQMGLPGIAAFLFLLGASFTALWPRPDQRHDLLPWNYALAASAMNIGVFLKNMTDDFFVNHNAFLYWILVGTVIGALTGSRDDAGGGKAHAL